MANKNSKHAHNPDKTSSSAKNPPETTKPVVQETQQSTQALNTKTVNDSTQDDGKHHDFGDGVVGSVGVDAVPGDGGRRKGDGDGKESSTVVGGGVGNSNADVSMSDGNRDNDDDADVGGSDDGGTDSTVGETVPTGDSGSSVSGGSKNVGGVGDRKSGARKGGVDGDRKIRTRSSNDTLAKLATSNPPPKKKEVQVVSTDGDKDVDDVDDGDYKPKPGSTPDKKNLKKRKSESTIDPSKVVKIDPTTHTATFPKTEGLTIDKVDSLLVLQIKSELLHRGIAVKPAVKKSLLVALLKEQLRAEASNPKPSSSSTTTTSVTTTTSTSMTPTRPTSN